MPATKTGETSTDAKRQATAWLGASEMAGRLLAFDWRSTSVGPVEAWPPSLKAAVATCLHSRFQMAIYWGADLVCIYNDAERDVLGDLHPRALGMPARELLRDSWEVVGPQLHAVMTGEESTWAEDQALTFDRRGAMEVGYFTYSYSPIIDDHGQTRGVLLVSQDTTARVLAERRLDVLKELAARSMEARTSREACELAAEVLAERPEFPFTLVYLSDRSTGDVVCAATSGVAAGLRPSQHRVKVSASAVGPGRVFAELADRRSTGVLMEAGLFIETVANGHAAHARAFATTLNRGLTDPVAGFFIAGVGAERASDPAHRTFLDLVATGIGRSIAAARSRERERERAQSAAALDAAKIALFSNTSHELRTPLTLILGPLDELLDDPDLPGSVRQPLTVARRNAARMLKLVTSMLNFSQIEAGDRGGDFRSTDLAELTRDIAAMFRSTAERANARLGVDCPPLPDRAYVDREGWEGIISNLLSNALKFTPEGAIDVSLREEQGSFVLRVQDTGIGIPWSDREKIFSRFYRGSDPRARTHEGSGIGLALVRELVRLHGGTIEAHRRPGHGTSMIVRIPIEREQAENRLVADEDAPGVVGAAAALFIEEASGWLSGGAPERLEEHGRNGSRREHRGRPMDRGSVDRVLVVEDNGDMRDYLWRVLEPHFEVVIAANGSDALHMAIGDPPSVVITDAMMPGLDGLGLVRALRDEPRTRGIPLMMISALADPESRLQAIDLGTDDYLVKPFTARELVRRVRARLDNSRARDEDAEVRGREIERALREDELRALLNDLRTAQRRVATAADAERRRIERNLHDGAQQRLMAIRLELGLLGERLQEDPVAARAELDRLHTELQEALEELRTLAHGLYPPLLASDGLHAALLAATVHAAIPVVIEGRVIGRAPQEIESAAYFACLEAIQNATKHAGQSARASVRLDLSKKALTFSVTDDGTGVDTLLTPDGQGLINLRDRLGALGGTAEITSIPGRGTKVLGWIPLP
jgi:signal transduction histidine kinase/DNA-binding response OmpR family regulator